MIPTPIVIPIPRSYSEYQLPRLDVICPGWVTTIEGLGILMAILGAIFMIATVLIELITGWSSEKLFRFSLALALAGLGILLISMILIMITGQPVIE